MFKSSLVAVLFVVAASPAFASDTMPEILSSVPSASVAVLSQAEAANTRGEFYWYNLVSGVSTQTQTNSVIRLPEHLNQDVWKTIVDSMEVKPSGKIIYSAY
ncbi:MAG: hypothetical protein QJT81_21875 [Candidatus Thiothrix putei]|uniref:Uncharacterized protein n=1 Tax=Candidatus Thiothrix putei TaxID=3080811 RepID=A0AA95HF36_9GAMM|nr:MAG: hypothetical protein QJT81_21875 [Candidatus Thiothrix putei]